MCKYPRAENWEMFSRELSRAKTYQHDCCDVTEVELVSICEAYATTPLDFLWHNISTPPVTVLQMSRYEVCVFSAWFYPR